MINEYITSNHLPLIAETIKTYVDYKINELDNKTDYRALRYDDLYYLRGQNMLQPGSFYCIYDYVTTTSQLGTISAGNGFPIVVLATSTNTLSEEAITFNYTYGPNSSYWSKSNLNAWKIWYCLDNDTNRFTWAGYTEPEYRIGIPGGFLYKRDSTSDSYDSEHDYFGYVKFGGPSSTVEKYWTIEENPTLTEDYVTHTLYTMDKYGNFIPTEVQSKFYTEDIKRGKGVIYRMIDEHGNDCPYDFKNIMFKNPNDETDDKYYYTFYYKDSYNEITDATTVNSLSGICYNNVIKYFKMNGKMYMPNNIFRITPGRGCYNNSFGDNCYNNTFEFNCHNNTFGDSCYSNSFGNSCYNNTFGDSCYSNSFGNNCYNNNFGNRCFNNTFGNNCYDNIFGRGCYNSNFGNSCYNNNFGYINNTDSTTTEVLNGIVNCYFSNEYQYNELKHLKTSNTNSSDYLKNVHFCKGIKGQSSKINTITIEGILPDNTETKVAKNSKGELKIYCEADLIA